MRRVSEEIDFQSEQILETAIKVFCEKGYTKTRMDDIANILKISKTPLYYHFKDKAGLFDAAYKRAMGRLYENDMKMFSKDCCLYEKLTQAFVICAISSNQQEISEMSRIVVKEREYLGETLKYMEEMHILFHKFKTDAMKEAQAKGEIKADADIDELYAIINSCYIGVISWIDGVDREEKMSSIKKEKIVSSLLGKIFEGIKPLYFNESC